jgi:hypothetical protein
MSDTGTALPTDNGLHFLVRAVPIKVACEVLYRSRSWVFEQLGLGKLSGVTDGNRTLVTIESIRAYQQAMPPAVIKAPPPPRLAHLGKLHVKRAAARARKAKGKR